MGAAPFSRGERGIAMVTAVMVTLVVTVLGLISLRMSLHSADTTANNRKRVQAVGAAEAGIDFALAKMQDAGNPSSLPCTLVDQLQTSPTVARFTATITYFDGYPTGNALPCTPGGFLASAAPPEGALIVSKGTTNARAYGERTMESLVRMDEVASTTGFDKAIFSNSSMTVRNNTDVYGENGPDGDVYTNGDFVCDRGNQTYRGNIIAPTGSISFLQRCTVEGDLYARNNVTTSNNALVAHDVKSSQGNISMSPNTEVRHDAIARGTNSGGVVRNNRVAGASLPDPVPQSMPVLNYDEGAWTSKGYTVREIANCTGSELTTAITSIRVATGPLLIKTDCPVTLDMRLELNNDLAIFADGGIEMRNNFDLLSLNTTVRTMHFIVPTDAVATTPCTIPGITTGTGSTFYDTVHYLMYTPCKIDLNNANGGYGQIYGGSVSINNNFTFHYAPVPVFGAVVTTPSTAYTLDIAYKREIANT